MQANELRIGNIVDSKNKRHNEEYIVVESIASDYINIDFRSYSIPGLIPIPLTEEWMVKLGFSEKYPLGSDFTPEEYNFRIFNLNDFEIEVDLSNNTFQLNNYTNNQLIDYKYVHQLQNLYFALTGKELTI